MPIYFVPTHKPPQITGEWVQSTAAWWKIGLRVLQAVALLKQPAASLVVHLGIRLGAAQAWATPSASTFTSPIRIPTAQKLKALSSLNRKDLEKELREFGVDCTGATVEQMRETLREVRKSTEEIPVPKLKGLSAMKKAELVQMAMQQGIDPTGKTCAQLRLAIQGWEATAAAASGSAARPQAAILGSDLVTFGRYKGEQYRQILRNRQSYAAWVVTTKDTSECHALLRLAKYLEANGIQANMQTEGPITVEVEVDPDVPMDMGMDFEQYEIYSEDNDWASRVFGK